MNAWHEILADNAAEARVQLDELCHCGVRLGDHYTTAGAWLPCEVVSPAPAPSEVTHGT